MAISPKLLQKQSQSLVMTPQLQQAIKLLQLSNIEVAAFIEEQLEQNPLLERGNLTENRRDETPDTANVTDIPDGRSELELTKPVSAETLDAPAHAVDSEASPAETMAETMADRDRLDRHRLGSDLSARSRDTDFNPAENHAEPRSLSEVLTEQLNLSIKDPKDRLIGQYLIDQVDENGYCRMSPDVLAERLGVPVLRIQSVLTTLKGFEPTGVFAKDLVECLSLQLRERDELDKVMYVILQNLTLFAKGEYKTLAKLAQINVEQLSTYLAKIKSLSPKPGLAYGGIMAAAITPDVFIRELPNGGWGVELNTENLPQILVNNQYMAEISAFGADETTQNFISECHQNANWLIKSLDQRARTILKVASEIVKQQDEFFAFGIDYMRPLNLQQVAEAIEMHESTVSRVTSNKYAATPRGMFELKFFFSGAISSTDGRESYSSEAIRHKIKILIQEEFDAKSVKSDDKLVQLLRAQGVDIARRTVAKYRESMSIGSSVDRRRAFKKAL